MGDPADRLAGIGVSDVQCRAILNLNSNIAVRPYDVVAVEADVDVSVAFPCRSKGHVAGQEVIASDAGQATGSAPSPPCQIIAMIIRAVRLAANLVLMSRLQL